MTKEEEILSILQEECAEVIQAVSKVRRFGKEKNIEELCQEIADCEYLIKLAKLNIAEINQYNFGLAEHRKHEKLRVYSKIFDQEGPSPTEKKNPCFDENGKQVIVPTIPFQDWISHGQAGQAQF
jgi:NTP pyrophosphatase (non-canonical NTP hydrolase)